MTHRSLHTDATLAWAAADEAALSRSRRRRDIRTQLLAAEGATARVLGQDVGRRARQGVAVLGAASLLLAPGMTGVAAAQEPAGAPATEPDVGEVPQAPDAGPADGSDAAGVPGQVVDVVTDALPDDGLPDDGAPAPSDHPASDGGGPVTDPGAIDDGAVDGGAPGNGAAGGDPGGGDADAPVHGDSGDAPGAGGAPEGGPTDGDGDDPGGDGGGLGDVVDEVGDLIEDALPDGVEPPADGPVDPAGEDVDPVGDDGQPVAGGGDGADPDGGGPLDDLVGEVVDEVIDDVTDVLDPDPQPHPAPQPEPPAAPPALGPPPAPPRPPVVPRPTPVPPPPPVPGPPPAVQLPPPPVPDVVAAPLEVIGAPDRVDPVRSPQQISAPVTAQAQSVPPVRVAVDPAVHPNIAPVARPIAQALSLEDRVRASQARPVDAARLDDWTRAVSDAWTRVDDGGTTDRTSVAALDAVAPQPTLGWSYEIQPGDSLWTISEAVWGTSELTASQVEAIWQLLYAWNADRLGADPDTIPRGVVIQIPIDTEG